MRWLFFFWLIPTHPILLSSKNAFLYFMQLLLVAESSIFKKKRAQYIFTWQLWWMDHYITVQILHYLTLNLWSPYSFSLKNIGPVTLSYQWLLTTPEQQQDDSSALTTQSAEAGGESTAISVYPLAGEILPGKEQTITVKFSPLDVGEFSNMFRCKWDICREFWLFVLFKWKLQTIFRDTFR